MRRSAIGVVIVVSLLVAGAAFAGDPCRDPWISEVGRQEASRMGIQFFGTGENGMCNINLYGHDWSSKDQLRQQVSQALQAIKSAGLEYQGQYNGPATVILDRKFNVRRPAGEAWVGPSSSAPANGSRSGGNYIWQINLPRGYVLAIPRPCPLGSSASPTGACKAGGAS